MSDRTALGGLSWTRLVLSVLGIAVSLWPTVALRYVDVAKVADGLLPVFPMLAGFLVLALTLQRDAGWSQRQNWRRVNVERRLAERGLNWLVGLLFLYILTFVLVLVAIGLGGHPDWVVTDWLTRAYLITATLALYATLFLPFQIRRMHMLPYDDLINEKLEPRLETRRAA